MLVSLTLYMCPSCGYISKPLLFLSFLQSAVPQPTFSMPVTVPVSNQNALQFSNSGGLVTTSFVTSTLTDPRLLSPQQPSLQRNTGSPGLPQRPASAGKEQSGRWLMVDFITSFICHMHKYSDMLDLQAIHNSAVI